MGLRKENNSKTDVGCEEKRIEAKAVSMSTYEREIERKLPEKTVERPGKDTHFCNAFDAYLLLNEAAGAKFAIIPPQKVSPRE